MRDAGEGSVRGPGRDDALAADRHAPREPAGDVRDGGPSGNEVAIVGLAGRFPGAPSVDDLWRLLRDGRRGIRALSADELRAAGVDDATLRDPAYVRVGAPLDGFDRFDAAFFGFSPRDAAIMDPQHRHFLECAWEALEGAGHTPARFPGAIGVFGGCGMQAYFVHNLLTNPDLVRSVGMFLLRHTGNDKDFLTTRASYLLDLTGPSVSVQTACSTSLVAVHLACQSLLAGECDLALAGGVTIEVPHGQGYHYREGEILAPDGHCRAFDARAAGTVFGSGVGVVALRRLADALEDGDAIHAVIIGSAVNNDGALKAGYLAPSVEGQARAVAEALAVAGVDPATIGYIEAHGTGTPVGDPIEVAALTRAFRDATDRVGFCRLGSVKPSIGHLDTAAGVASLIKATLAVKHGEIPASLDFETPNPELGLEGGPFVVNDRLTPWATEPGVPRRAGVNSLGVGGTNAFVVLEEGPAPRPSAPRARPYELLPLSAKTPAALDRMARRLAEHLDAHPDADLADVAYTLGVGRKAFGHRRVVAAGDPADAARALAGAEPGRAHDDAATGSPPSVVFAFAGGGVQHPGMGRDLYAAEPAYRDAVEECLASLPAARADEQRRLLTASHADRDAARALEAPSRGLPALFVTQYALARLWQSWGVEPAALVGHSAGEYAAACLAGVLAPADALALVCARGDLFETLPPGGMTSVHLPESELRPLLGDDLALAAVNGPALSVASGPTAALDRLERELAARGVPYARVRIDVAAHSPAVDPLVAPFGRRAAETRLRAPSIPYVSTLTGEWVTAPQAMDPDFWARHLRAPVRFADAVGALLAGPRRAFVEVGPGQALASLLRQHPATTPEVPIVASLPRAADAGEPEHRALLTALGRLWAAGLDVDWGRLHAGRDRRRVPLPTYPFERGRYWIEPGRVVTETGVVAVAVPDPSEALAAGEPAGERPLAKQPALDDWTYRPVWRPAPRDPVGEVEPLTWLVLADEDDAADPATLAGALVARLRDGGHRVLTVAVGRAYARRGPTAFALDPARREEWDALVGDLQAGGSPPDRIVHLWSLRPDREARPDAAHGDPIGAGGVDPLAANDLAQARGFFALFHLAQAIGDAGLTAPIHLGVVTSGLRAALDGDAVVGPERATVDGPCRVVPRELPNVSGQSIDVALPAPGASDARERLEALARQLVAELARPLHEPMVALRGADRLAEVFERAPLAPAVAPAQGLRERGVYLIAGGLGGIGLTLAEHLARTVRARLVLVGRAGLPPRETWDALLADRSCPAATRDAIRRVRALESLGAEVLILAADVADPARMARVVAEARARFGALHGAIHAAGVLDDAPLQLKAREDAERVLAPKVRGALALDWALRDERPDFVLLCSSTSALLGQPGQIDYAGANAFLDAFAESRRGDGATRWIAVDWGIWREVGMAERAAGEDGAAGRRIAGDAPPIAAVSGRPTGGATGPDRTGASGASVAARTGPPNGPADGDDRPVHPLLGVRELDDPDRLVYRAEYADDALWVLDGHRLRAGGVALLPGAAYPEIARAALAHRAAGRDLEIHDLALLAPLALSPGERRVVRVTLDRDVGAPIPSTAFAFVVESRPLVPAAAVDADWTEHARAAVRLVPPEAEASATMPAPEIGGGSAASWMTRQDAAIRFGERWDVVRAFRTEGDAAHARLELAERFAADLDAYGLHPALLDMATSVGLPLIPGYADADEFYVPLSWGRTRVRGPLARVLLVRASLRDHLPTHGVATFDVTVADERGRVLAEVEGFSLKRVEPARLLGEAAGAGASTGGSAGRRADAGLRRLLAQAIRPGEGAELFARIVAAAPHRIVATSIDLHALLDRAATAGSPAGTAPADAPVVAPRAGHVPPRTDVERALAGLWRELLGVAVVGVHDDFFELGGHSLVAVRLLAQVRRQFGVDLALDTLFRAPTVAAWAEIVERRRGRPRSAPPRPDAPGAGPPPVRPVPSPAARVPALVAANDRAARADDADPDWSPLVEIQAGAPGLPPFFCIHGAGGNVVNVRDLARHLGSGQPFYGLQARGVDGRLRPLARIEEMAALYLDAIRAVQPFGPYYLGGYSGGGVIAFEMAHQLLRRGERAAGLAFIDTFCPVLPWQRGVRGTLRNFQAEGIGYARVLPRKGLDSVVRGMRRGLVKVYEWRRSPLPHELRFLRMWDTNLAAIRAYRPAPYPGRVALFRAAVGDATHAYDLLDLGWGPFAEGGVELYEVPGTHDTLVLEPNVQVLAAYLREYLDRVRAAEDAAGGAAGRTAS